MAATARNGSERAEQERRLPDARLPSDEHERGGNEAAAENPIELGGEDALRMQKLLDVIEELDDVQDVYTNIDIPDDVAAQLDED